ncbi:hypothetical protein AALO_G00094640 [Alosa alosa]|uniref:Ig-like domain-containing protein n=1 Tax=Alosa alosa TaxID=278164 RepID=A0AAV6GT62_9TELE|nr:hypothetical protein AALO_G00094640 [Alosa alosa]
MTLTCRVTNCPPGGSTYSFTWSKDGHPVEEKQIINNQLQLHPVTYEDEGNYTCAVRGHEGHPSPAHMLNVQYSPRNTVVSRNPSNETLEGDSVTLTCSSDANPPVENYTWFKDQDDDQYANIGFQGSTGVACSPSAEAAGGAEDDGHYSNIQPHGSTQTAGAQEDDVQYASVQFKKARAAEGSPAHADQEDSVIYSGVQSQHPSQLRPSEEEGSANTDIYSTVQKQPRT